MQRYPIMVGTDHSTLWLTAKAGPVGHRIRAMDWSGTPLGPLEHWPSGLRTLLNLMLETQTIMSLVWGPDAILLFNDAFAEQLLPDDAQNAALGASAYAIFSAHKGAFADDIAAGLAGTSRRMHAKRYLVRRNGKLEDGWFDVTYAPVRDDRGAVVGVLWTLVDITGQWLAQQTLRNSEARHRLLIEKWTQAVWETDADGVVVHDSPSWRASTGQTREQWLGDGWLDAIHPEDRAYAERQWREAVSVRRQVDVEFRIHAPDGAWRWTNVRAAPMVDDAGNIAKWVGINIDIDERMRAENALRVSEERLRGVLDLMAEGFALFDADFTIVDVNQETLRLDGRARDELVGRSHWEVYPGSEDAPVGALFKRVARDRVPAALEHHYRWPDGHAMWVDTRAYPTAEGGIACFWRDITDRKVAEEALRASEARYHALFASMDEAYAVVDVLKDELGDWVDFRFVEVNPAFIEHTGMPWPVGQTATQLLGAPNPRWTQLYGQALDTGRPIRVEEAEPTLDRVFDLNIFTLDRARNRVAVLFTNVTERKRTEATLRESEERHAFLVHFSDAVRGITDPAEVAIKACRMVLDQLGVDRAHWSEIDWDRQEFVTLGSAHLPGVVPVEGRFPIAAWEPYSTDCREGRPVAVSNAQTDPRAGSAMRTATASMEIGAHLAAPVRVAGRLVSVLGVNSRQPRQWTTAEIGLLETIAGRCWAEVERARAEAALRESEDRRRIALEGAAMGAWRWDTSKRIVWADRPFQALWGLSFGDEPHSVSAYTERMTAAGAAVLEQVMAMDLAPGQIVEDQVEVAAGPTQGRWVQWRGRAARDTPWIINGVSFDITEQKLAEEALRSSEERFRQFAEASADALWIRDATTYAFEYVSPAVQAIFGVSPQEVLDDPRLINALIIPEDRDAVSERVARVSGGEVISQEYRIRRASDGLFRWVRSTGFPLRDATGTVRRIAAIAADVSEARQLAEHRSVLLAELQHRVRNIMGVVRSIGNRSAENATEVGDYRQTLEGRMLALARVQALLTRGANAGGSLRDIIESEVRVQAHHPHQFELVGPDITLSPKTVEVLTLAFHELSTNALKYGAFSVPDGRLVVRWSAFEKRGAPWLGIDWIEEGAPPRAPSTRRGFGSELIELRIPYELGGTGKVSIGPDGAHCRMEFPLTQAKSILETDAPMPATTFGGTIDMSGAPDLGRRTVLVVEDDYYVAADTTAALRGAGATVLGPCPSEEAARELLETQAPTHAVLDLNLGGGGPRFEIAQLLKARAIPFIFITGYDPDVIPPDLADVPRLQKPVPFRAIVEAVSLL